ncbi:hypothetical protein ACIQVT_00400 [Streptomyces sp. NPDC100445]|uniref:hypothetical protein n=1 Tax=Streptomyces sp. NPDC100445 TaxID=3366102 RepID=UPI003813B558
MVEQLSGEPTPRDLKYAVLHLQAGTEVLLKARLQQAHWTLIVQDLPAELRKTKKGPLRERVPIGSFASCGIDETLTRLREVVGLDLDSKHLAAVAKLGQTRNALQHYGLTQSAPAVEAQAATVLDFLLTFLHEHLLPHLDAPERVQVEAAMDDVRHRLGTITKLIQTRMNGLKEALAPCTDATVLCPDCGMPALVAGVPLSCRFCYRSWTDAECAAADYVYAEMVRKKAVDPLDNEEPQLYWCPTCDTPTIFDVERDGWLMYLCMSCAVVLDTLIWCRKGCGSLIDPKTNDFDICPACMARLQETT